MSGRQEIDMYFKNSHIEYNSLFLTAVETELSITEPYYLLFSEIYVHVCISFDQWYKSFLVNPSKYFKIFFLLDFNKPNSAGL